MPEMTVEQALDYASALCNRAEYCTSEIAAKLKAKGLTPPQVEETLAKLKSARLIDDKRYAGAFVRQKFRNQLWGKRKIETELRKKRIDHRIISAALAQISDSDYRQAVSQTVARKAASLGGATDAKTRTAIARFALSRGYEPALVFQALDSISTN